MRVFIVITARVEIQVDHNLTNNKKTDNKFSILFKPKFNFFFTQALFSTFQQYQGYWDNIYLKVMRLTLRGIHK